MPSGPFRTRGRFAAVLVGASVALSCGPAPAADRGASPGSPAAQESGAPRGTIRIAWGGEPPTLAPKMAQPGASALSELAVTFNSSLTYHDPSGKAIPMLARAIPDRDRGDWVVNPDGTMITTWQLRENARWHDGRPLTAGDYVFAYQVYVDPEVPVYRRDPETSMSKVEAKDDYTLVISWKQPHFGANALWYRQLEPLPRHLLEEDYRADKASFITGARWTTEYVGSGPFRLERWDPGSGLVARAFQDWVLGPPKAAILEIRFITDGNTILAGLLAGDLDVSGHPWFPPSLAAGVRDRWVGGGLGYISITESRFEHMDFQFREVAGWQPALTDVRARQAFLFALDRQALVELMNHGLGGSVADAFLLRTDAVFPEVDRALTKYPYDPGEAARFFADAGWVRSRTEGPLTNSDGQTLRFEIRGTASAAAENEVSFIESTLKASGVDAHSAIIPIARGADAEFQVSFPGGNITNRAIVPDSFIWTSAQAPTPQNRWLGSNRGSFRDAEVDRLQNEVVTALDPRSWTAANVALHKRMSEVAGTAPLFYPADIIIARSTVTGPVGHYTYPAHSWNVFEWAVE